MSGPHTKKTFDVRIGRHELVIRQRYEAASISNDILIGLWFVVGSIMFLSPAWATTGTWLFLIGSVQMLIRPVIRLSRLVHVRRIRSRSGVGPASHEASMDF
ncbi:YrhK family protein [Nocardiopsis sp. EMB25]|uniref:YrhK family protein n=1 Tax=Nocardiopsis TaxID=2013 RepID=UPI0003492562|nr:MULTISPECIES: YrhK family protein [Nocardiopsis]MCY9784361.1 YrhK family protein [Nocardiopsis sp. EMB25]